MSTAAVKALPIAALSLAVTACGGGGLGDLGEILTGTPAPGGQGQTGTLTAEIQEVRDRQQEIIVRTQDGQQGAILFDRNTQVVYQNQEYAVGALERGDIVEMRVQEVQQGYYTDLIQVRTPVQERQGATGGTTSPEVYRVEGTIGSIDLERWTFSLNMTQGGTVQVVLPSTSPASARDRLRQYRAGDYVQVEVRPVSEQQAELVRFGWSQ